MTHAQHQSASPIQPAQLRPEDQTLALAHIQRLRAHGATYRAIAEAAGLGTMTVHDLAESRSQPAPDTLAAILAIQPAALTRVRVDAGGTRLRLRALHVMGHGPARLARATGASEKTIRAVTDGQAQTVSARLRDAVIAIYDRWWDKRAPERTPSDRAAASLARRRAIRGNWCAGAALDDDQLDTPGYKPAYGWRPASGTGTADTIIVSRRPRHSRRRS
jgi:transcriptional regulator with XRE-family HTH domain